LVQKRRRDQPRLGGKKLFKLLSDDLQQLERSIGRDKFFDILREKDLLVKRKKKFQRTTNSYHRFRKYKNCFKDKEITAPSQAWVSDMTYMRTKRKFIYLFLITDAYSRKIIGWKLSESLAMESAMEALSMAISQCSRPKGVIHHSDRGFHYCNPQYVNLLQHNKMIISMTEENHCYENAMAERVNGILKDEFLLDEEMPDLKTAIKAVKQAIETYNTKRPHWSLGLQIPYQIHLASSKTLRKSKNQVSIFKQ
jgi:putative transposase